MSDEDIKKFNQIVKDFGAWQEEINKKFKEDFKL